MPNTQRRPRNLARPFPHAAARSDRETVESHARWPRAEPLEPRRLLTNGAVVPLSTFSETSYQSRDLAPFTLSTQTVAPDGYISVTYTAEDPVQIACSDARPKFCTLDGVPVTGTEGPVALYRYDAPFPDPDDGAYINSPAGTHTATFQIIPAATTEGITEEDDANGNPIGYAGPWIFGAGSNSQGNYSSAQPFNIVGDADTLSFLQQPSNSAAGDTIKPPVTVAVQTNGVTDTSATDSITLALASGTGTLAGTLTEPAVAGVATFSDLSIDTGGTYTITADDGSTTPVLSSAFDISAGKLVFKTSPHSGSAGEVLKPAVTVKLEDGKGSVITTDSSSVVTLTPVGVNGAAAITGNTATLVKGVATFSDVVLTQPATYQLQASDGGDAAATSGKFKIDGDHLVFNHLPKTADAGSDVQVQILVENSKNRVLTDNEDPLTFDVAGFPAFDETTTAGVSTFSYRFGIDLAPATYLLTATDAAAGSATVADATASIKVLGDHLAFNHLPKTADAGSDVQVQILVENSKNRVLTDNEDPLTFDVAGFPAFDETTTAGVSTFAYRFGVDLTPGTFTLTATDTAAGSAASVADATASVKVLADHLVFAKLPKTIHAGSDVTISILVENSKKRILTDNEDPLTFDVAGFPTFDETTTEGVSTFTYMFGTDLAPGAYSLTATDAAASSSGAVANATASAKVIG